MKASLLISLSGAWRILSVAAVFAISIPATEAALQIHRCTTNGKTVISDQPCTEAVTPAGGMVSSPPERVTIPQQSPGGAVQNYATPYGEWRGQTQFQATEAGQVQQGAHAVVGMTIMIDTAGKIVGRSPDNGCTLLGVAAPFVTQNSLSLDVTLSACKHVGYNRRYSGYLHLDPTKKIATLTLNGTNVRFGVGSHTAYDIRGSMRR